MYYMECMEAVGNIQTERDSGMIGCIPSWYSEERNTAPYRNRLSVWNTHTCSTHSLSLTHTHISIHTDMHTHTHSHSLTHTHTHTHTATHTHSRAPQTQHHTLT